MKFARFLLVGVFNTFIGLSSIYVAMGIFQIDYRSANAIGFGIGCTTSFLLNRSWTFRSNSPVFHAFVRWIIVVAAGYGVNFLTLIVAYSVLKVNAYLAQFAGILTYTAFTYIGARFFAFSVRSSRVIAIGLNG